MGAFAAHVQLVVDALQAAALSQCKAMEAGITVQVDMYTTDMQQILFFQIDTVVLQAGIGANHHLGEAVDKTVLLPCIRGKVLDDLSFTALLKDYE